MDNIQAKVCRLCGREKTLDEFHKNNKSKDGHQSYCKECNKDYSKRNKHINETPQKTSNPDLAQFTPRQLIEELRSRGYKGTLTYEFTITL